MGIKNLFRVDSKLYTTLEVPGEQAKLLTLQPDLQ